MNPTQQEQLINIGAYLRDLRKEKGADVDEVANQIFIRPALVKAIETGDWESLPEPVFVQGFIRRYADYLGLDGQEIAQQFEPTPVAVLPDPTLASSGTVEGVVKQQDKHGLKVLSKVEPSHQNGSLASSKARGSTKNWLVGLIALAALGGLVAWLTTRNTPRPANSVDNTPVEEEAIAETPSTPASEEAVEPITESPTPVAEAPPNDAPVTLSLDIEEDAWMRVTVDDEVAYEGILAAGTQETWTAQNEISITAGNSGGVLYSFNGGEKRPLGAPGAVSNLTLTPDTDPTSLPSP